MIPADRADALALVADKFIDRHVSLMQVAHDCAASDQRLAGAEADRNGQLFGFVFHGSTLFERRVHI